MKYLSLIIFFIATAIHLFASLKKDTKVRNLSKPFILLALLGYYCYGAAAVKMTVVLALLFSWAGDILLIPKGVKWFTAGGISFMISHFFFILSYLEYVDLAAVGIVKALLLGAFFFAAVTVIFSKLRPHLPKGLFYPMFLYLLINGAMNCFAIFRYLTVPSAGGIITVIGAFLFFISDSSLFFVRFDKNSRLKTHFLVMLTYSIGEFLIILGLIMH